MASYEEFKKMREQRLADRPMTEKALGAAMGAGEVALSGVTGMGTDIVSGLTNLAQVLTGDQTLDQAVSDLRSSQAQYTYQPKTPEGQQYAQFLAEKIGQPYEQMKQGMGETALERTGSPLHATATHMLPDVALTLSTLGLGNLLTRGGRLKTRAPSGDWQPTPVLENALRDKGMTFQDLSSETVARIPESLDSGLLPSTRTGLEAKKALESEAAQGGRIDALAPYQLGAPKLKADPQAKAVLSQGVEPNIVQMIKTSSGPTRFNMARMLGNADSILKNKSNFNEKRPLNIVGDSVGTRLIDLRKIANEDRIKLEQIKTRELGDLRINTDPISTAFNDSLAQYGINIARNEEGGLDFDYSGSELFKDRQGQRLVEEVTDILDNFDMTNLNGAQAHLIKKQIDSLLNYEKIDMGGVSDIGERVAKAVRLAVNDSIREVSPDYAAVNDRLTSVLDVFNGMQRSAGKRINLFDPETNARQLGQEMRKLLSNYKSGPELEKAIAELQAVSSQFGVEKGDNLADLVEFANFLENRFKVAPSGSLRGVMQETATDRAVEAAASGESLFGFAKEAAKSGYEKIRGINDDEAIKSLYELIRKGQQ